MRILVVTNMYPTEEKPSYGIFVKTQMDAVAKRGHELKIVFINGSQSALHYLRGFKEVRKAIQEFQPDVIHAHYGLTGFIAALGAIQALKIPLVLSLCGDDVLGTPKEVKNSKHSLTLKSQVIRALSRVASYRASKIIVKSEEMARVVRGWGIQDLEVIPNGVDTEFFFPLPQETARRKLGLEMEKKYLLFPHTPYEVRKRVDLAKEITERVKKAGIDVQLLVIYHQKQEKLRDYYSAANCMLLTSEWEGSPNVLKEAMACNLPTVCFDVGDVKWLSEHTEGHYVIPRGDLDSMAQKVVEVLQKNPEANGRKKIEESLSGLQVARRIEGLLEGAVHSGSKTYFKSAKS